MSNDEGARHEMVGMGATGRPTALLPVLRLHGYKLASRDAFLELCRGIGDAELRRSFPIGMGSLWATLTHLYGADVVWIDALTGVDDTVLPASGTIGSLDELLGVWSSVDDRWHGYLATLREERLTGRITRRSRAMNRSYTVTVLDVLLHVCTHQAHTIAQGRNMLRSLGLTELPRSDLIFWSVDRQLGGGA